MEPIQISLNKNNQPILEHRYEVDGKEWWEYSAPGVLLVEDAKLSISEATTRVDELTQLKEPPIQAIREE